MVTLSGSFFSPHFVIINGCQITFDLLEGATMHTSINLQLNTLGLVLLNSFVPRIVLCLGLEITFHKLRYQICYSSLAIASIFSLQSKFPCSCVRST